MHSEDADLASAPAGLSDDLDVPLQESWDILIVEDDGVLREQLAESFSEDRYTVTTARNGREALRILQTHRVGVVLLDLMLPVMSGWDLIEVLKRADVPPPPMLVITAVSNSHRAPGGPVFLKPLNLQSLRRAVRAYLGDR